MPSLTLALSITHAYVAPAYVASATSDDASAPLDAVQHALDVASRTMLTISVSMLLACMFVLLLVLAIASVLPRRRDSDDPRGGKHPALPLSELGTRR